MLSALSRRIAGSCGRSVCDFLRSQQTALHGGCAAFTHPTRRARGSGGAVVRTSPRPRLPFQTQPPAAPSLGAATEAATSSFHPSCLQVDLPMSFLLLDAAQLWRTRVCASPQRRAFSFRYSCFLNSRGKTSFVCPASRGMLGRNRLGGCCQDGRLRPDATWHLGTSFLLRSQRNRASPLGTLLSCRPGDCAVALASSLLF